MDFMEAMTEVKDRLETAGEQAQRVAKASLKTLKAANVVVLDGMQGLVKTQTEVAKNLLEAGKQGLEKARTAGLVAVAQNPSEYFPDGREALANAFSDSIETLTKTRGKLFKVIKLGYTNVAATVAGKPMRMRKPRRRAKRAARKIVVPTTQTSSSAFVAA